MGQTKKVVVFTLVARDTVEDRLLSVAHQKRVLEHVVMDNIEEKMEGAELEGILRESSKALFNEQNVDIEYDDAAIDALLNQRYEVQQPKDRGRSKAALEVMAKASALLEMISESAD